MDESVDPASVSWGRNDTKRAADQMMFRALSFDLFRQKQDRGSAPLRVLSFPGKMWFWEQSVEDAFPILDFRFLGLERDRKVHGDTVKMANMLPGRYRPFEEPTSFLDYTRTRSGRRSKFDLLYLDWMGTWSIEKKTDLDAMLDNGCMLEVGGVLVFTISLGRGQPATLAELEDQSYDLPLTFYDARGRDKYVSNLKVRGIPHWVENRARDRFDIGLRPIMANIYYSSFGKGQSRPQLQLMFLRES